MFLDSRATDIYTYCINNELYIIGIKIVNYIMWGRGGDIDQVLPLVSGIRLLSTIWLLLSDRRMGRPVPSWKQHRFGALIYQLFGGNGNPHCYVGHSELEEPLLLDALD
jgi:hypothetical protein